MAHSLCRWSFSFKLTGISNKRDESKDYLNYEDIDCVTADFRIIEVGMMSDVVMIICELTVCKFTHFYFVLF